MRMQWAYLTLPVGARTGDRRDELESVTEAASRLKMGPI